MISEAKARMRVALFSVAASVVARVAASVVARVVYEPWHKTQGWLLIYGDLIGIENAPLIMHDPPSKAQGERSNHRSVVKFMLDDEDDDKVTLIFEYIYSTFYYNSILLRSNWVAK